MARRIGRTVILGMWAGALSLVPAQSFAAGKHSSKPAAASACTLSVPKDASQLVQKLDAQINSAVAMAVVYLRMNPIPNGTQTYQFAWNGVTYRLTASAPATASPFTYTLQVAPAGSASFVTVSSGSLTSTPSETKGQASINLDALHTADPKSAATGQVTASFDFIADTSKPGSGQKRMYTVSFTNVKLSARDAEGPRTGSYYSVVEPGVGGVSQVQGSHLLVCKGSTAHPTVSGTTVDRWYTVNQQTHSRLDTRVTGGPLAAGQAFVGVTCATPAYTLSKIESSTGSTVAGSAKETGSPSACDPAFGAVPSPVNNTRDYSFPATPAFPNEW